MVLKLPVHWHGAAFFVSGKTSSLSILTERADAQVFSDDVALVVVDVNRMNQIE